MKSKIIFICLLATLLCQSAFSINERNNPYKYLPVTLFMTGLVTTFIGAHPSLGDGNHWTTPICCDEKGFCVDSCSLQCSNNTYLTYHHLGTPWGGALSLIGVTVGFMGYGGLLYQSWDYLPLE